MKHIIDPEEITTEPAALTEADLKRDFEYHMAMQITQVLLDEGRITAEEYEQICREHVQVFNSTLAPLIVDSVGTPR